MGGSSGGSVGSSDLAELRNKLKGAETELRDQNFETESSEIINSLLGELNNRDAEGINANLENIRQAIADEIEGTIDLRFGGSVAKHTYVDGLSDIDTLVLLNKSELKGKSPREVKEYFLAQLRNHLPDGTPIDSGALAVTVTLGGIDVQLLPAIKYRSGFRIADPSGEKWSVIHPRRFSTLLTEVNQKVGNVVPTIKLAKSIIADFPDSRRLNGYHIETLAVQIFREYTGPKTTKAMLKHYFAEATSLVTKPVSDITGQSVNVDEYLGAKGSKKRQTISDSLSQVARRMEKADNAHSLQEWKSIFALE
jgi:hypothetical protein